MKIFAVIQVRMSSRRFPGKVLHPVGQKPLLHYILESLAHCSHLDGVVVATSAEAEDTPVAEFCRTVGVDCFRGPLADVAGRFDALLERYIPDAFVRICGDSPLISVPLLQKALDIFREGGFDMVTNVLERTFPKGQSVEIVAAGVFRRAYRFMADPDDLEHVTPYFYRNRSDFNIYNMTFEEDCSHIQLSVDYLRDMEVFSAMIAAMNKPHWQYDVKELVALYRSLTA